MSAERYHDGERDYREPEKYKLCQSRASVDGTAKCHVVKTLSS